jgi:rhomboid protease GluP
MPEMAAPTEPVAASVGLSGTATPFLTLGLAALLVAVFVGEQIFAVGQASRDLTPSLTTLSALGGLVRPLVLESAEWYRLFTAPLLHGGVTHVFCNIIALILIGIVLERLLGHAWFLACYVIGGLGGAFASLALNPPTVVSVGASGAIMGLFAAAFVCSFRVPAADPARHRLQILAVRVLIPSLLPLAATRGVHVDYGAHLGGAVSGTLVGLLLLKIWPSEDRLPRLRWAAAGIAVAGVVLAAAAVVAVAMHYPDYRIVAALIPDKELPKTTAEMAARGTSLLARYPEDPRAYAYRAVGLLMEQNNVAAEAMLRRGLERSAALKLLGQVQEDMMRGALAMVLAEERQLPAAREEARGACRTGNAAMRQGLDNYHLCDAIP